MAQVPRYTGGARQAGGGDPTINVQRAPGGALARGLQGIGQEVAAFGEQVAQHQVQMQLMDNKVQVDQRALEYDRISNDTVREFQEANPGMAAYEKRHELFDTLEAKRAELAGGLNPAAAIQFNSLSRTQFGRMQATYSTWAAGQRQASMKATSEAVVQNEQSKAAADHAYTPFAEARITDEIVARAEMEGWTEPVAIANLRNAIGSIYQKQIAVAVNTGNFPEAEALFEEHKSQMTDDQIASVSSAMKVGRNAFEANTFADEFIANLGEPGTESATPSTTVDALSALKAAAPGATITSTYRTPEHNKAVGGVDNSFHTRGDKEHPQAADFTPAPGQTMSQLATQLRSARVGEVIPEDDHVHVEFGPGATDRNHVPKLAQTDDPELWEARALREAQVQAAARFPNNPVLRQQAEAAARSRIADITRIRTVENKGRYDNLLTAIESGNLQAEASLANAYPGATSDLANLPAGMQRAIRNSMKGNANEMTPERQLELQRLNGIAATATDLTSAWFKEDISKSGLPAAVQTRLMKQQADDRAAIQRKGNVIKQQNFIQQSLRPGQPARNAIDQLGIRYSGAQDADNTPYYQFVGALQAEVENFQTANKGAFPNQVQMKDIVSRVSGSSGAKRGWGWFNIGGSEGTPNFQVPEDYRQQVMDWAASQGRRVNEEEISAAYQRSLRRGN